MRKPDARVKPIRVRLEGQKHDEWERERMQASTLIAIACAVVLTVAAAAAGFACL